MVIRSECCESWQLSKGIMVALGAVIHSCTCYVGNGEVYIGCSISHGDAKQILTLRGDSGLRHSSQPLYENGTFGVYSRFHPAVNGVYKLGDDVIGLISRVC